jgi:hypothetical protein
MNQDKCLTAHNNDIILNDCNDEDQSQLLNINHRDSNNYNI